MSEHCGDCDGVGWVEGGPTIKTTCGRCRGRGIEPPAKPIGYRYEVTAVWGDVPPGVVVGGFIVETAFKGEAYSWELMDLPTGTVTAIWDGRYIGVRSL